VHLEFGKVWRKRLEFGVAAAAVVAALFSVGLGILLYPLLLLAAILITLSLLMDWNWI
jgi:hypothetical protein